MNARFLRLTSNFQHTIERTHSGARVIVYMCPLYLSENREEQGRVEDGRDRSDRAELRQRLGPADGDEGHRHEHPQRRHLPVAVLDAVEV